MFSLLLLSTAVLPGMYVKVAVYALVLYGAWVTRWANASVLLLISSVLLNFTDSSSVLILMTLPAYLGRSLLGVRMKVKTLLYLVLTAGVLCLALFLGESPNGRTMLLFMLCCCAFFSVANEDISASQLKAYALSGMIIVLVALARSSGTGLMYGRLSINGSIRTLANATSIVLLLLVVGMLKGGKEEKSNILHYAAVALGVLILFATLSRGAIVAFCAGAAVLFLMAKMPLHKKVICIVALAVVIGLVVAYLSKSDMLSTNRLTDTEEGFNGRTDIWTVYWRQMTRSSGRLLFGFGPGDVKRLHISDFYAHSLFLDILFSYGVVGFVLVMGGFIAAWAQIWKSRNAQAISIAVFAMLLFATHGVSTVSSFYILTGIGISLCRNSKSVLPEKT